MKRKIKYTDAETEVALSIKRIRLKVNSISGVINSINSELDKLEYSLYLDGGKIEEAFKSKGLGKNLDEMFGSSTPKRMSLTGFYKNLRQMEENIAYAENTGLTSEEVDEILATYRKDKIEEHDYED